MNEKDIWIRGSRMDAEALKNYLEDRQQATILGELQSFMYLMMEYRCAIREIDRIPCGNHPAHRQN